jgi:hypothetical protein
VKDSALVGLVVPRYTVALVLSLLDLSDIYSFLQWLLD